MKTALLHVIRAEIGSAQDAASALRALRRASGAESDDGRTLLLFCDLAPAHAERMPDDEPILRSLQSSVMAMNARRPGRFHLLVRRREWDDACRQYAAPAQPMSVHRALLDLLAGGTTQTRFSCATVSPAALQGCCPAVLIVPASYSCTPDTPPRMLGALQRSSSGCLCGRALHRHAYPESILDRLVRTGFSLMPLRDAQQAAMQRQGLGAPSGPAIFTIEGLRKMLDAPDQGFPVAPDCLFVQESPASLTGLLTAFYADCLRTGALHAALPVVECLLLFASAILGYAPLAAAAVLLPELGSLRFVRRMPGALIRLALLPLCALLALDALLKRKQAFSARWRVCVPPSLLTARSCAVCGGLLLLCALSGVTALASLLPVCLFWLSSPLLLPALQAPTIERIPLSEDQLAQLRSEAESAFFDCIAHCDPQRAPALHMLAACAAGMLGLLEPDETGRRVQKLLEYCPAPSAAADMAAMLAAAQYLREQMSACDAALRELPSRLEAFALAHCVPMGRGMLSVFLNFAQQNSASPEALSALQSASAAHSADLLFLPLAPSRRQAASTASLALTHPHTYLRRSASGLLPADSDALMRFLFLAAAALSHPFHALLMRSPVCAPYASLWAI